jgi:SAM-dependent methyltransferase
MKATTWKEVWEARRLDPAKGSVLAQLIAADGFDDGFSKFSEEAWRQYVLRTARTIGIGPESKLFDVGCGAGAFLFELARQGCRVAGLDASSTLLQYAARAIPGGTWIHADAAALEVDPAYDFVIAGACFHYFPSLEYAGEVLRRMVGKARRGVAVLDVPDLALREQAIEERRRLGGGEAYERKYDGLSHLYYPRDWFESTLARLGVARVEIAGQHIEGYANSAHRFNVFGWLAPGGEGA